MSDDAGALPVDHQLLETLLDVVIPPSPDGRLPGAGTLGLTDTIARTVRQMPMLRPVLEYGFGTLAELAMRRNAGGWGALTPAERAEVFAEFTATDQFFLRNRDIRRTGEGCGGRKCNKCELFHKDALRDKS